MKVKYIKVSVSDILPENDGLYMTNLGSLIYSGIERKFYTEESLEIEGIEWFLKEVPDYEDEMKEILEECQLQLEHLNYPVQRGTTNSVLSRLGTLLTKIKNNNHE
ncbi:MULTISPECIES: hypothetical protein [unclassified Chryseobacterium]|uniref:hypothetical protein n=1 Tax=unclassified Chryseobacterium TaxID=2593645 RepID=UPI0028530653|nr:hypothetical protein [Chryseobacterium sp. CFS7]MDR4892245.1 hypothetical protein [Chryseobacterium sp. CFS7]